MLNIRHRWRVEQAPRKNAWFRGGKPCHYIVMWFTVAQKDFFHRLLTFASIILSPFKMLNRKSLVRIYGPYNMEQWSEAVLVSKRHWIAFIGINGTLLYQSFDEISLD